jgi:hypothetical protein
MCSCNGNKTDENVFVVTFPDGSSKEVKGEFAARVAVTEKGGGTFRKK